MDLTPGSPEYWIERLSQDLDKKLPRLEELEAYACGDHPLPEGDERVRDVFRKFQAKARTNYCGLVSTSVSERLRVQGFTTGSGGTVEQDQESWRIWQANHLDADSEIVHTTALNLSEAYVIVGIDPADPTTPIISCEDPRQVAVATSNIDRRKVVAGIKRWSDPISKRYEAVLYLPGAVHYFTRPHDYATLWTQTGPDFAGDPAPEPGPDDVPIVAFTNRPRLLGGGIGEFEDALDVQARINSVTLDRLVIAKTQAYRQRWIKGLASEDEKGNPVDLPFIPGVDLLWSVDADPTEVEFGEFAQVDLRPLLEAAKDDVTAFVTLTGLPPHYVAGDLVNASADALAAAEARLVAKVRSRQRNFGESWEQVLEMAAKLSGRELPPDTELEWSDPERKTDAQLADAAVKKQTAGVPWRQVMADLGYTPQQVDRMEAERATDSLLGITQIVTPTPPPSGQPTG